MENAEKNLIKHCAQVYFTTNGVLLFHCVLCESQRLTNIQRLCRHLKEKHKNIILELKVKQNEQVEKNNEINIQECEDIYSQFEDSMDNNEEKSCESDMIIEEPEHEKFIDDGLTQFSVEQVVSNELEVDEDSNQVYADIQNVLEFIENNEQNKALNENAEIDNSHKIGDENFTPARRKLGAYYASRTNGEGEYQCPVCDRSFRKKDVLSRHLQRHKEPRIECDHCSKKFHTRTELSHHKRRINGVKPFMCADCGHQYSTTGALTQHMKRHLNIRDVECDICGKRFYDRSHLKHHYVVHTRERAFTCATCNSKFARRKSLMTHMKIHANKREYVCKVCGADFNQLPGLHVHMRSKHKDVVRPNDDITL